MKALKYGLVVLAAVASLLGAIAAYLLATFDPSDYHARIIELVKEKTGRTLTIHGATRLSFWPLVAVELGPLTLSERTSAEPFAHIEQARLELELRPLLSRVFVARQVVLRRAFVSIVRFADGRLNIDDLLQNEGGAPGFDIGRIAVEQSHVRYRNLLSDAQWDFSRIALDTARIADRVPAAITLTFDVRDAPASVELRTELKARLTLDLAARRHVLDGLSVSATGHAPGVAQIKSHVGGNVLLDLSQRSIAATQLAARMTGQRSQEAIDIELMAAKLFAEADHVETQNATAAVSAAGAAGTTTMKFAAAQIGREGNNVKAPAAAFALDARRGAHHIDAQATTDIRAELRERTVRFSGIASNIAASGPRLPAGNLAAVLQGDAALDVAKEDIGLKLSGKIADSRVKAELSAAGFAAPVYAFSIEMDRLDLDRWTGTKTTPRATGQSSFDLSPLSDLPASGTLRIGTLKAADTTAKDVRFILR